MTAMAASTKALEERVLIEITLYFRFFDRVAG